MGVSHCHKLQGAALLQPGQVRQVPFAEAVDTHQGNAWDTGVDLLGCVHACR